MTVGTNQMQCGTAIAGLIVRQKGSCLGPAWKRGPHSYKIGKILSFFQRIFK